MSQIRAPIILLCLSFALGSIMGVSAHAGSSGLRSQEIGVVDTIRLSDLFSSLPGYLDRILGAAPSPGQQITLKHDDLVRIQDYYDLPDSRGGLEYDTLIIRHKMEPVEAANVKRIAHDALKAQLGLSGQIHLVFDDPSVLDRLQIPTGYQLQNPVFQQLDRTTQRFSFTFEATSQTRLYRTKEISGQFNKLIEVVKVMAPVSPGQSIEAHHLEEVWISPEQVTARTLVQREHIEGMQSRRRLMPGDFVREGDVKVSIMIKRGDPVSAVFRTHNLVLTSRMKALESGVLGQMIRLKNMTSQKVIEAQVTGPLQVRIN